MDVGSGNRRARGGPSAGLLDPLVIRLHADIRRCTKEQSRTRTGKTRSPRGLVRERESEKRVSQRSFELPCSKEHVKQPGVFEDAEKNWMGCDWGRVRCVPAARQREACPRVASTCTPYLTVLYSRCPPRGASIHCPGSPHPIPTSLPWPWANPIVERGVCTANHCLAAYLRIHQSGCVETGDGQ